MPQEQISISELAQMTLSEAANQGMSVPVSKANSDGGRVLASDIVANQGQGFNPRGPWIASVSPQYEINDIVTYGGQTFRVKEANSGTTTPWPQGDSGSQLTAKNRFELWAAKGIDGEPGAPGAPGGGGGGVGAWTQVASGVTASVGTLNSFEMYVNDTLRIAYLTINYSPASTSNPANNTAIINFPSAYAAIGQFGGAVARPSANSQVVGVYASGSQIFNRGTFAGTDQFLGTVSWVY
jgi:hypothetical protein